MEPLKIGQITDLHARSHLPGSSHLLSRKCRQMPFYLKSALAYLKNESCDLVVLTGDLVDVPHYITKFDSLNDKKWWVEGMDAALKDYHLIREILTESGLPYIAIPGNHDDERMFSQVFPRQNKKSVKGWNIFCFFDREGEGHVPFRSPEEMAFWRDALKDEDPQIHLQHYVIHPILQENYPYNYSDADTLAVKMKDSNKSIISLSAHYHSGTGWHREGNVHFTVGPSLGEFPHRFRMYHLLQSNPDQPRMEEFRLETKNKQPQKAVIVSFPENGFSSAPVLFTDAEIKVLLTCVGEGFSICLISGYKFKKSPLSQKESVDFFHDQCLHNLEHAGLKIDGIFALNRGQETGLSDEKLQQLILEMGYDISSSYFLSKDEEHLSLARDAGLETILIAGGNGGGGCSLETAVNLLTRSNSF